MIVIKGFAIGRKKVTGKTMPVLGEVYESREEAEAALKSNKMCIINVSGFEIKEFELSLK